MSFQRVPQEQVPALLGPDPQRGPWAVVPQFTLMEDGSLRCSGVTIEWSPMLEARDAGQHHLVEDEGDGGPGEDGDTMSGERETYVPWEVFSPGTMPPPEELTATVIRSIPISTLVARARKSLRNLERLASALDQLSANPPGAPHEAVVPRRFIREPLRRRPGMLERDHFEEVAKIYKEAEKKPRKAVAEWFGVSPATASDYIGECRRMGLLPRTTKGRAAR